MDITVVVCCLICSLLERGSEVTWIAGRSGWIGITAAAVVALFGMVGIIAF